LWDAYKDYNPTVFEDTTVNWVKIGPWRDTHDRALRHGPKAYGYNADTCMAKCHSINRKYFALQNGGWCSCENSLEHIKKYGPSNCGEMGGGWCNYVYEIKKHTEKHEYTQIASYKDTGNRAMRLYIGNGFSQKTCLTACGDYKFFALQYNG
jgi:hypothetical protein